MKLLLPYERHTKGENDKPLPSGKPKKQEPGSQEAAAKPKAAGAKKPKGAFGGKQVAKKEKEDPDTLLEHSRSTELKLEIQEPCAAVKPEAPAEEEPIVVEEEDELHLTLKKEETKTPTPLTETPAPLTETPAPPEWTLPHIPILLDKPKFSTDQHHPQLDAPVVTKSPYHPWENSKPAVHVPKPELGLLGPPVAREPGMENHGGRVGKVLPMCKQPQPPPMETDSGTDKQDYGGRKEPHQGHPQTAAYCKAGQGVMSPLAKKKLLSQVCETNPYSFISPPPPPLLAPPMPPSLPASSAGERDGGERCSEEGLGQRHGSLSDLSGSPEVGPIFRPSVIQHAQSAKPLQGGGPPERSPLGELSETYTCRVGHPHLQPRVNPPWHPYLHRTQGQDGVENAGEKLLHVPLSQSQHSYGGDCYSSPHLHSLYRQTENCLSQERMVGYANGEKRGHYIRDCDSSEAYVCSSLDREGLSYRPPHYTDRTHGDSRSLEDEPRDFSISKPVSQRLSYPKPSFCGLPYPMMHHGLDSHPKACRVPPMTVPKHSSPEPPQPFLTSKPSPESVVGPVRPTKRSLCEPDGEGPPDRKVRVVTPMHPAGSVRRGDPQCGEELKAAEPAHAVHLSHGGHLPDVHPATTYPPHHSVPLYPGMYPGTLVPTRQEAGLQQHHLQYLKSQTAISPLVPPLAFHSMMLHRQLMATGPSPHHFYRHPGGAALYGDMLHHLYPLSTLTPPQLSSVHPSTRL
ncbi:AT-rich interactive domain-containing protein 5B-like [Aplochiton taeniatus]